MPTANPKHRPGNMPAPVYPAWMVAVSEVLQWGGSGVDQLAWSERGRTRVGETYIRPTTNPTSIGPYFAPNNLA